MSDHKFQINLRGIIDLLSNHLYSSPDVFVRELLQNGVDAIRGRTVLQPEHQGEMSLEVVPGSGGKPVTLIVNDNGIGLTEDEVHRFLATIGQSSKTADLWERPTDFIGQFGIGILSCFLVSDEIVVITRSARDGSSAVEWRGRPDGTYALKTLQLDLEPGTQVYLSCKKGCEEWFDPRTLIERASHFGGLLPYPIVVKSGTMSRQINEEIPPWRLTSVSTEERREALLEYGRHMFQQEFFDAIPLRSEVGDVEGVAFVLPFSPGLAARRTHRVYLKGMLLSEEAENLMPDWTFFVKCIVNANDLRPTASRESFYEDDQLATTRANLGECLRNYLITLADREPERLQRLISLHALSIKALAVQDAEFCRLFVDWLPFETTLGRMTFGEYRQENDAIYYVPEVDQFRQIARVASAQNICVINAGYVHDAELMERLEEVFPDRRIEMIDPSSMTQAFEELTMDEREEVFQLVKIADVVLQPFRCGADVKKFLPDDLPALYSTGADAQFIRGIEQSKEVADPLWSSVLDRLSSRSSSDLYARLCLNYHNPLIRKLARITDRPLLERSVQMLYIQALLLGHHPLSSREMTLLNDGLIGLIELGVDASGDS